jgi:hypothetical protein
MRDLLLPAFEMDCRDWLVVTPAEAGLPDEVGGAPLLAVLSTVVLDDDEFQPASGVLTLGLLDDEVPPLRPVGASSCSAAQLVEPEYASDCVRYVVPVPDGRLALLAEFTLPDGPQPAVLDRIEALMASFRWAE